MFVLCGSIYVSGFMPKMSLRSILPSRVFENGTEFNETGTEFETEGGITWENEIVLAEARDILERTMFPFKKVSLCPSLLPRVHVPYIIDLTLLSNRRHSRIVAAPE